MSAVRYAARSTPRAAGELMAEGGGTVGGLLTFRGGGEGAGEGGVFCRARIRREQHVPIRLLPDPGRTALEGPDEGGFLDAVLAVASDLEGCAPG